MRYLRSFLIFLCIAVLTGVMVDLPGMLGSLTRLAQWPALIVWAICVLVERKIRKPHPFHWAMLCFIVWNVVTAFWSDDVSGTLRYCSRYMMAFIVSIMMWDTYRTKIDAGTASVAFVAGCYVIVLLTMSNSAHDQRSAYDPFNDRFTAGNLHPDDLGLLLSIGIPLAWRGAVSSVSTSIVVRALCALFPFAAVLAIVMSGTRGALLASVPGFVYLVASIFTLPVRWRATVAVIACVGVLACMPILTSGKMSGQIDRLGSSVSSLSASGDGLDGRVDIWRAGWTVFQRNPVVGIGAGAFPEATRSFMDGLSPTGEPLVAHNTYLSILTETGLIGFAIFLGVMWQLVKSIMRYRGAEKGAWIAALAVWLIGVSSLTFEYRPQTWLLFTIILIGTQHFERVSVRTADGTPPARNKRLYSRPGALPLSSKIG